MHRSSSASRVSAGYLNQSSSPARTLSLSPSSSSTLLRSGSYDTDQELPTYNPQSHVAKKELTRQRSAETAVHLIPILLVLCAFTLWIFSSIPIQE